MHITNIVVSVTSCFCVNSIMHLADAFIQRDILVFVSMCVPWESNPQPFALLTQCSNHWATGTLSCVLNKVSVKCRNVNQNNALFCSCCCRGWLHSLYLEKAASGPSQSSPASSQINQSDHSNLISIREKTQTTEGV